MNCEKLIKKTRSVPLFSFSKILLVSRLSQLTNRSVANGVTARATYIGN